MMVIKKKTLSLTILSIALLFLLFFINLSYIGCGESSKQSNNNSTTTTKEWHNVQTFNGKGNQDTSSFAISGDKVKITATTSGGTVGTYSSVRLKSDKGDYLGAGLSISTEGAEDGHGETTYRNLKTGDYYISVISGVNWEVKVEEYR